MNKWTKKRSVMRRYDLTAQMYDSRYSEEQQAKYKAALDGLSVERAIVLDMGCGTGLFFDQIAAKAISVTGVDVSRRLLHLAKKRGKTYSDVHLVQADVDNLPFQPEVFTHVFAFTVLQNMPNASETLKQCKMTAKKDACFVVSGLKGAIPLETLGKHLKAAGLQAVSIRDDDALRCCVVTCI